MTAAGGGPLAGGAESALAPLVGLPLWMAERDRDVVAFQFGPRRTIDDGDGARDVGEYALRVSCAWRLADATGILAASGDLFTPADPDADIESFDWEVPGATWLDLRLRRFTEAHVAEPPVVATFLADAVGGFRIVLSGGIELETFPNSSAAEHVETEFWRLLRPGEADAHIVAGTFGIELQDGE